jgi:hypothetical protein
MVPVPKSAAFRGVAAGLRKWIITANMEEVWLWSALALIALVSSWYWGLTAFAAFLGLIGVWRLFRAGLGSGILWLAAAILAGSVYALQNPLNRSIAEKGSGSGSAPEAEKTIVGGKIQVNADDTARMDKWKKGVEEALIRAETRRESGANGAPAEGPEPAANRGQESAESITTDLGIIRELRNQQPKVMKPAKEADATETAQPEVTKHSLDRSETDNGRGSIGVVPLAKPEEPPSGENKARKRGRWRHGWAWIYRVHTPGVARAGPVFSFLRR